MVSTGSTAAPSAAEAGGIVVERYKYILQQLHTVNENVYRFLAIFQTVVTALATAALALFLNYATWKVAPDVARTGVRGLLLLATAVAAFTVLMIVVGVASWLDYRREECILTATYLPAGFREPPRLRNFHRWYETYVVLFVVVLTALLWILSELVLIPRMV